MASPLSTINVLEVNTSFGYAGAQRTMISFCKYFSKHFKAFALSYGEGGPREKDLQELGIPFFVAHKNIEAISSFVKDKDIHVVHIHRSGGYDAFEFSLLKRLKEVIPNVVIIETNVFGQFDKDSSSIIDCHLLKSKMMLNERFVKAFGKFDFEKMKVVYNPVDHHLFEQFKLSEEVIKEYKKELGIPENAFVVGRLGRPDISKWSDLLLEMFPLLLKEIPEAYMILQAVPPSRIKYINKQSWKKQCIILPETGNEAEIHRFYQVIDVLAHSSKIGEAFGNTLNEAMYWKKPVVVNSTPKRDNGQIEQIEHMKTGIIANYPETYARALAYLAKNPEEIKRLGEQGHDKVTTEYDPKKTTERLEKVFIEKLKETGCELAPELIDFYLKIEYYPTASAIDEYRQNYKVLSRNDFGKRTILERLRHYARTPKRLRNKVADFIEHRWK